MKTKLLCCCLVLFFLQIMTWVSASSRLLPTNDAHNHANAPGIPSGEEVKKIVGSRPPNCASKCYGCSPCVAIQVPTINAHLSLQYANYLPEGWKCKCGPSLYTP